MRSCALGTELWTACDPCFPIQWSCFMGRRSRCSLPLCTNYAWHYQIASFKVHGKIIITRLVPLTDLDSHRKHVSIWYGVCVEPGSASLCGDQDNLLFRRYATILAFDVKVERDAQDLADTLGVKIFQADIIYHLFDKFMAYREELRQRKREEFKHVAVFPCKLRILPHVRNNFCCVVCLALFCLQSHRS